MARTPLASQLQKLYAEFCQAQRSGLDLDGYREAKARVRGTDRYQEQADGRRRALLGLGAAGMAGLWLSPGEAVAAKRRPRPHPDSVPRIAIVGGGIAGLSCALELMDNRVAADITVYEGSGRVGGRMFSNTSYWENGQVSEWGGEFIDTGHQTMRQLARRFGLPLDDLLDAQPPGSEDTYRFFDRYYPKAQADRDFSRIFAAVQADLKAAPFPMTYDNFTPAALVLDRMSVFDWIETRVPGGHASSLGQLLDVAYAIEFSSDTSKQSALNLLYLLGFQPNQSGKELAVFGESDERFHIRGGNMQLPVAMANALGVGDRVKLRHWLNALWPRSSGGYSLVFDADGVTKEVVADYVVLALPFAVLRQYDLNAMGFDELKQTAIRSLGRGVTAKIHLQFNQRLWNGRGPWPGVSNGSTYADTGYQSSWDVTRGQRGRTGIQGLLPADSAIRGTMSDLPFGIAANPKVAADARRYLSQLEPVFPGLTRTWNGRATQSLWHHNAYAGCSYSYYAVGQYTQFGGYEKVRQGNVFFCGEHTSTDFQGFMEGGAEQGQRVGRQLSRLLA